jgi:hypothetical protein
MERRILAPFSNWKSLWLSTLRRSRKKWLLRVGESLRHQIGNTTFLFFEKIKKLKSRIMIGAKGSFFLGGRVRQVAG